MTAGPVTGGLHWESPHWTLDGEDVQARQPLGALRLHPPAPLAPGGTLGSASRSRGRSPPGICKRGGGTTGFILPSGVVLTSFGTSFAPRSGSPSASGVDDENSTESKEYPDDYYVGQTEILRRLPEAVPHPGEDDRPGGFHL